MSATEIFTILRKEMEDSQLHLRQIHKRSGIPYHRIYRFWTLGTPLSIEDANKLFVLLTGKSFIQLPDDNHVL